MKANFQADLQAKLGNNRCSEDLSPETLWDKLKTTILQTSEEVLGFTTKRKKDWFDENNEEIQKLLTEKRSDHQAHLAHPSCPVRKAAFRHICSNLQLKLRVMQNEWWTNLPVRTQQYADAGDFKGFYEAVEAVYGQTHQARSPLRSEDGQALLKEKISILSRWSEHLQELFSADPVVQDSTLLRIPQLPVKVELDKLPSMQELIKAIEQMKSGKAAGVEEIPPDFWESGGPTLHSKLYKLLVSCWEQGKYQETFAMQSLLLYTRIKGKSPTVLTTGNHSAFHCRKNLCLSAPKQASTYHCKRSPFRNLLWLQSKLGNHRHGLGLQATPRKVSRAEQKTVCNVC